MSTTKHTPGPWKVIDDEQLGMAVISPETGYTISTHNNGAEHSEEEAANAARIAACVNACEGINPEAVPEMLSMLKQVLETYRRLDQVHGIECDAVAIERLIAEAEGPR